MILFFSLFEKQWHANALNEISSTAFQGFSMKSQGLLRLEEGGMGVIPQENF